MRLYRHLYPILLALCLVMLPAAAQMSGPYAMRFGAQGTDQMRDMCVDATGSYIMTFTFEGSVTFPGGTNSPRTLTSNGPRNSGLVRYDFLGNLQWALSWGNESAEVYPVAIACAADRSTYVAGRFTGTFDADPGFGERLLTSNGEGDAYLIKFDASGNFAWARSFGGTLDDEAAALALDGDGNPLLTMLYQNTLDADPDPANLAFHQSQGGKDILFIKLTPAGNYIYSRSIGGVLDDGVNGVSTAFDAAGNLVVAGAFQGTIDIDPSGAPSEFTSQGDWDVFIARYTPSGNLFAGRQIASNSQIQLTARSLAIDDSDNIYLTGSFRGEMRVDPMGTGRTLVSRQGSVDVFLLSYTRGDLHRWSFSFGSLGEERSSGVSVDRNGIVTIAGSYQSSVDLDPGSAVFSIMARSSGGASDGFAARYRNSDGSFMWGIGLGAVVNGPANQTAVIANELDTMGSLILAGTFYGSGMDMHSGAGAYTLSSAGGADLFLAVYDWRGNLRKPEDELQKPVLRASTNAASFLPGGVVPGSLATLFGLNITTKIPGIPTPQNAGLPYPIGTKLCNTEVIFTDPLSMQIYKAPILFCSQFQVNYQVPSKLPIGRFVTAQVVVDDVASNSLELLVKPDDVGIFMEDFAKRLGAMIFAIGQRRGQKVSSRNPITACDITEVYVTGLGLVTGGLPEDGFPVPGGETRPTPSEAKIVLYDDGTKGFIPIAPRFLELRRGDGFIQYSGLTPGFVGLYQINMEWPNPQASPPPFNPPLFQGDYPAFIEFNGRRSQHFVIPVRYDAEFPSPCRRL
ncbi:MAG: hypothetical protein LC114_21075 [Bryobacterales bacterium]|nr:hypothetical protein [Bryobacterales bacterium]